MTSAAAQPGILPRLRRLDAVHHPVAQGNAHAGDELCRRYRIGPQDAPSIVVARAIDAPRVGRVFVKGAVAAPVRDHTGQVIAAVSISGPAFRITPGKLPELSSLVCETATHISRELGYQP